MRRRGFTLVELLVVVAIIAVLISIMLPALGAAREASRRVGCGANLAMIGKACIIYGAQYNNQYPTLPGPFDLEVNQPGSDPASPDWAAYDPPYLGRWLPTTVSVAGWVNEVTQVPFVTLDDAIRFEFQELLPDSAGMYVAQGDALANFWLLNLYRLTNPKNFVCPSDPSGPQPALLQYYDPTGKHLQTCLGFGIIAKGKGYKNTNSYGFPYPWYQTGSPPVNWWRNTMNSQQVIGADMGKLTTNPGQPQITTNSPNHGGKGQNVAYADGHVAFSQTNKAGIRGDNIYTASNDGIFTVLDTTAKSIPKSLKPQCFSDVWHGGVPTYAPSLPWQDINDPTDIILVPARP